MFWTALFIVSQMAYGEAFSFHLFTEPSGLDPQITNATSGNYLLFNMHRGLLRFSEPKGLQPDGATSCERKGHYLICHLDSRRRWSTGDPIRAQDYVIAFRRLVAPATASGQSDLLEHVVNAPAILNGSRKPEELGVVAENEFTLKIDLASPDPDLEYKLALSALAPWPPGGFKKPDQATSQVVSGPYKIVNWKKGQWIDLKPNPHYPSLKPRPDLRVYFIDDDATALRLFQNGKLKFHRRIPNSDLEWAKSQPGFQRIAMARFDYVGFGPQLKEESTLREALVKAIDFTSFLKLIDTISPPGCPSMPSAWLDRVHCQKADFKSARTLWRKLKNKPPPLSFSYSSLGGDDIARTAAWFQNQWKKTLELNVELRPVEQGVYLRELKTNTPPIFRKGISLDRPTCLAALEIFTSGHRDNYIQLQDSRFDQLVKNLAQSSGRTLRSNCRKAVEHLLSLNRIIPLGEMYFNIVAAPEFTGWQMNSLNQLDLSQLSERSTQP